MGLVGCLQTDGECQYKVTVNGNDVLNYTNPRIFNTEIPDYTKNVVNIGEVDLKDGDEIRVYFKPNSNKLIPENDGFAFARARWEDLSFE